METESAGLHARLFRNGPDQAVGIPPEFELPGVEVLVRRDGGRLIVEPVAPVTLGALLSQWEPLDIPELDIPDPPADPLDV